MENQLKMLAGRGKLPGAGAGARAVGMKKAKGAAKKVVRKAGVKKKVTKAAKR